MKTVICLLVPALLLAVVAAPRYAAAETETFRVKSMAEREVLLKFFSQDRRVHWPAGDNAFDLNDYKDHDIKLNCVKGEQICYGAWLKRNRNTYWGTGPDGKASCRDCCFSCEGRSTREVILRDPVRR